MRRARVGVMDWWAVFAWFEALTFGEAFFLTAVYGIGLSIVFNIFVTDGYTGYSPRKTLALAIVWPLFFVLCLAAAVFGPLLEPFLRALKR